MSPSRPYLLNALYEWILDNHCTPYVAVNALYEGTIVPQEFVKGGQIILDIQPSAVHKFSLGKEVMQFSARFGGVSRDLYIPIPAITAIYAKETGGGMVFPVNEYDEVETSGGNQSVGTTENNNGPGSTSQSGTGPKKPNLRIVK